MVKYRDFSEDFSKKINIALLSLNPDAVSGDTE
jgi:hypothetical protein